MSLFADMKDDLAEIYRGGEMKPVVSIPTLERMQGADKAVREGKPLTLTALTEARTYAARMADYYTNRVRADCKHCEHMQTDGICRKFDARPPDEFVESEGQCDQWLHDQIPF